MSARTPTAARPSSATGPPPIPRHREPPPDPATPHDRAPLNAAVDDAVAQRHHIRVNGLHPTGVATPMGTGDMRRRIGRAVAGDPRLAPMFTNLIPVDITQPEDVARTVLFLASDESRYITAHEISPDAGVTEF